MHLAEPPERTVKLVDVIPPEAVVLGLGAGEKPAIVRTLVSRLVASGHLQAADEAPIVDAILSHEGLVSTGIGNGIAVPNCRTSAVAEFVGALGVEPAGVPFGSLDGRPVFAVFVLVAPLDRRDQYFDVLGRVAAIGTDTGRRLRLQAARTPAEAHAVLREFDPG
jgi:mannitol/fructose-specific phosphotransferase system IIA component (Ntr-type)